jgi:3-oxoacyl-[acyl-carrier-protein] synthase-3
MRPLMRTDSERLMREGIATGMVTFESLLKHTRWSRDTLTKTVCHQVGGAHHKLMFETLGLDPAIDFSTLEWLGNTGSVALPMTMAMASERGWLRRGDKVGMLGIGSGINCIMLAVDWHQNAPTRVPRPHRPVETASKR